jgi:hypothetical protein
MVEELSMRSKASTTEQLNKLIEFRQSVYRHGLIRERDGQFELVEAVLLSPAVESFPALSQSPAFRRKWSSAYTAIQRGEQDPVWLRRYLSQQVPSERASVFALDPSVWPRPRTRTLQGLRFERSPTQAVRGYSIVKGYAYSMLAWIPQRGKSWALPVDTRRIVGQQTAVEVGVEQVKTLCQNRPDACLDIIVGDGTFGNHRFLGSVKDLPCAVVVRLRRDRVLYGEPGPYQGKGRPRVHGRRFAFKESERWGPPDEEMSFEDERYGQVRLRCWHHLHARQDANTPFSVIRAEVHLQREKPPDPIWLGCLGADAHTVRDKWLWFDLRWPIEPAFRFRKQRLCWSLPHFQQADRCDRWTLLVDIAYWQVFLARHLVSDQPLPWQKSQTDLTPGRVTQSLGALFAQIGPLACPPQPRGKSPGWPVGRPRTRPRRYPVLKRGPKRAKAA